jgi:hypothetical protein
MGRTLNEFLSQAGVKVAAASPAAAAAATAATTPAAAGAAAPKTAAAPAKAAGAAAGTTKAAAGDIPPSQPSKGEAAGGHKTREKKTQMEDQDTGAHGGDTAAASTKGAAVTKTATQLALEERGISIADPKLAELTLSSLLANVEQQKEAELNKFASEMRAQGALMYQGMIQESTAWKLANGETEIKEAQLVAAILQIPVGDIIKRAEQIGGAMTSPALVGGMLGSAARTDSSETMRASERNGSTTETRGVEALAGTRGPVSGADDKLKRFTDVFTLPGSPGLNHGQVVDQGKKLGE